jgi:hypothetical protein
MDLHVAKACAGLRGIAAQKGPVPDYFLYIGDDNGFLPPETIAGIPVILTPAAMNVGAIDFGISGELLYLPCYIHDSTRYFFTAYLGAYEDWVE